MTTWAVLLALLLPVAFCLRVFGREAGQGGPVQARGPGGPPHGRGHHLCLPAAVFPHHFLPAPPPADRIPARDHGAPTAADIPGHLRGARQDGRARGDRHLLFQSVRLRAPGQGRGPGVRTGHRALGRAQLPGADHRPHGQRGRQFPERLPGQAVDRGGPQLCGRLPLPAGAVLRSRHPPVRLRDRGLRARAGRQAGKGRPGRARGRVRHRDHPQGHPGRGQEQDRPGLHPGPGRDPRLSRLGLRGPQGDSTRPWSRPSPTPCSPWT